MNLPQPLVKNFKDFFRKNNDEHDSEENKGVGVYRLAPFRRKDVIEVVKNRKIESQDFIDKILAKLSEIKFWRLNNSAFSSGGKRR